MYDQVIPTSFRAHQQVQQSEGKIHALRLTTAFRARIRREPRLLGIVNPIFSSNFLVSSPEIASVKYLPFSRIVGIMENLSSAIAACRANFLLAVVSETIALVLSTPPSVSNSPRRKEATDLFPSFRTNLGKMSSCDLCFGGYWNASSRNLMRLRPPWWSSLNVSFLLSLTRTVSTPKIV